MAMGHDWRRCGSDGRSWNLPFLAQPPPGTEPDLTISVARARAGELIIGRGDTLALSFPFLARRIAFASGRWHFARRGQARTIAHAAPLVWLVSRGLFRRRGFRVPRSRRTR